MDFIDGLGFYAKIKNYFRIALLIFIMIIMLYISFLTYKKKYILAKESKIYKKTIENINKYYVEYSDYNNNKYTKELIPNTLNDKLIGKRNVYYEKNNPNNYNISDTKPSNIVFFIISIICVILLLSIIQLYFLNINKNYASVIGSIELIDSLKK